MAGKHSKDNKSYKLKSNVSKKDHKKKTTNKNILTFFILLICISLLIYSGIKILIWFKDTNTIKNEMTQINEVISITEISNKENTEIIEGNEKKSSPYYDYIKMDLMNVDFSKLKNINYDTKGWIKVNGTNINYPFVQTNNNDYYLNHSITKQSNSAGWVFMDYRNNINSFNKNTIIYAHARVNQYMFGTLKNTLKSNWLNDTNNHLIKLSTENQNTLWQVFSVYHIPTTNDYIQTEFNNNDEFLNFATMLQNRSIHKFNTTINKDDKILTLSTCYGNDEKLVVHAKLIKYSNK